jgi:hypothetical protein
MTEPQEPVNRDRIVRIGGIHAPRKPSPPIVRPMGSSVRTFTIREPRKGPTDAA